MALERAGWREESNAPNRKCQTPKPRLGWRPSEPGADFSNDDGGKQDDQNRKGSRNHERRNRVFQRQHTEADDESVFAQAEPYRLRPDDVIHIQIYNESQVNGSFPIGKDGTLTATFLDPMQVEGMTIVELQQELTKAYIKRLRLRDPKVSVTIDKYRTIRASVVGFANRPGIYDLRPGDTLMTLLSFAGGYDTSRADMRRATLRRETILAALEKTPADVRETWLILLGTVAPNRDGEPSFQVSGPRLAATELAATLATVPGRKIRRRCHRLGRRPARASLDDSLRRSRCRHRSLR